MSVDVGGIYVPRDQEQERGVERVVVYRVKDDVVMFDGLNRGHSGAYGGPEAQKRFNAIWVKVGQMRIEGALQLYRKERLKTGRMRWWINHSKEMLDNALEGVL